MERLKNVIINPEFTIKQALKQMDAMGEKTLFVADSKDRLLGTVTDGDIRRWILKGTSLSKRIFKVMNPNPVCLRDGCTREEAKETMVSKVIECIPIVDDTKRIVSAIWWLDIFDNKLKRHKPIRIPVVIMAGGEGTRLSPFTNILPKPLMPVGEKPIIELIMDRFIDFGCKDFYLSLNYKSNIIKAYFADHRHLYNIHYIQEERPLGTIGSLHLMRDRIATTFFVTNCDILIDADYADIFKFHKENKNIITLTVSLKHYTIPYGICEVEQGGILKKITEKPEYDYMVNAGLYIMEEEVLKDIPKNRLYHMTDLINDYIKRKKKIGIYPVSEKSWLDMGQFQELQNIFKKLESK